MELKLFGVDGDEWTPPGHGIYVGLGEVCVKSPQHSISIEAKNIPAFVEAIFTATFHAHSAVEDTVTIPFGEGFDVEVYTCEDASEDINIAVLVNDESGLSPFVRTNPYGCLKADDAFGMIQAITGEKW